MQCKVIITPNISFKIAFLFSKYLDIHYLPDKHRVTYEFSKIPVQMMGYGQKPRGQNPKSAADKSPADKQKPGGQKPGGHNVYHIMHN